MTEKEYNEIPAIRRSDLWKMEESPEKYKWFLANPPEQTPAMAFGAACHKYVLERDEFSSEYAVAPMVDRRSKAGKETWDLFMAANEGKAIVSWDDVEVFSAMRKKLEEHPLASRILYGENGKTEAPFFWTDPDTKLPCKVKCDRVSPGLDDIDRIMVVDYKTTASARTEVFNHDIFKLGYHVQAAMYTEGVMRSMDLDYRPEFVFIAQEKKAPYSVNVIRVSEEVMGAGDDKFHELLEKVHICEEMDWWPGYCDGEANETALPGWMSEAEEEL